MAGAPSNVAWVSFQKQTAKGTPVALPTQKAPFAGGNILPDRQTARLSETDASRDAGVNYAQRGGVAGSPSIYGRDDTIGPVLEGAMGTKVRTGAVNFVDTYTPANALPYMTVHKMLGNIVYERFEDVMINELSVRSEAGSPLTVEAGLIGRTSTFLTADPAPAVAVAASAVYNYNEVAVTFAGGATSLISSLDLTYSNGVDYQQTDDFVPYDLAPGTREVTVGFDMIFETADHYRAFAYGSTVGTTQSATLYTTDLSFTFTKGTNNEIKFTLPSITVEELPPEPDPGGGPITVAVRAAANRSSSPVLTAVVKTQV